MMTNFKDAPKSITEIRADRSMNAATWTPRDVLISLLRDIDSGNEIPTDLIVMWRTKEEPNSINWQKSTKDFDTALGMLEHAKLDLFTGSLK